MVGEVVRCYLGANPIRSRKFAHDAPDRPDKENLQKQLGLIEHFIDKGLLAQAILLSREWGLELGSASASGRLKCRQNTIYLEQEDDNGQVQRQPIPVENVHDLYLFGEIDLNTKLLSFLAQNEIVVHCSNYYGFYVGSFYPRESNVSGHLLVRQVEHYLDPQKRLRLAKEFVSGALFHIRRNLNYYRNRGKQVDEALEVVEACMERIDSCRNVAELMSEEGRAREAYYGAFNEILDLEQPFEKRVRRPPDNIVNALLSFGNSLLYCSPIGNLCDAT